MWFHLAAALCIPTCLASAEIITGVKQPPVDLRPPFGVITCTVCNITPWWEWMQETAGQLFGDGRPGGCCRSVILGPGGQEGAVGWLFWGQEASRVGSPADGAPCLLPCLSGGTSRCSPSPQHWQQHFRRRGSSCSSRCPNPSVVCGEEKLALLIKQMSALFQPRRGRVSELPLSKAGAKDLLLGAKSG